MYVYRERCASHLVVEVNGGRSVCHESHFICGRGTEKEMKKKDKIKDKHKIPNPNGVDGRTEYGNFDDVQQ